MSSSWGDWSSWISSKVDTVMTTVTQGANSIGETIQNTFEQNNVEEEEEQAPNNNASSSEESNTNSNATATTSASSSQETVDVEADQNLLQNAQESIKSLMTSVVQTSKEIASAEEVQFMKTMASDVVSQTKSATINLLKTVTETNVKESAFGLWSSLKQSMVAALNQNDENKSEFEMVDMEVLFEEYLKKTDTMQLLEELHALTSTLSLTQDTKLIELIKEQLNSKEFIGDKIPETIDNMKTLEACQQISQISGVSIGAAKNILTTFSELLNTVPEEDVMKQLMLFLEKARIEAYRCLTKIIHEALVQIVIYGKHIKENKNTAPTSFLKSPEEQVTQESKIALYKDFIYLALKEMLKVSHLFSAASQKLNAFALKKLPNLDEEKKKQINNKTVAVCTDILVCSDKSFDFIVQANEHIIKILQQE